MPTVIDELGSLSQLVVLSAHEANLEAVQQRPQELVVVLPRTRRAFLHFFLRGQRPFLELALDHVADAHSNDDEPPVAPPFVNPDAELAALTGSNSISSVWTAPGLRRSRSILPIASRCLRRYCRRWSYRTHATMQQRQRRRWPMSPAPAHLLA